MYLSEISEFIFDWQFLDSHEYLRVNIDILWVQLKCDIKSDLVENGQK